MVDKRELTTLQSQAEETLSRLREGPRQPFFAEFAGTPKSGKSTCIENVRHFFRRNKYNVLAPTEGASRRTPYFLKDDLVAFNAWSACYALTLVLEAIHHSDRYELALLDRGLFDALVWFEVLARQGQISNGDRDRIQEFLLIDKWRTAENAVFLFRADPETSMQRENEGKLTPEMGVAMNPDFLEELNRAYETSQERFAKRFPHFQVIDTSNGQESHPQATAYVVASAILNSMNARANGR